MNEGLTTLIAFAVLIGILWVFGRLGWFGVAPPPGSLTQTIGGVLFMYLGIGLLLAIVAGVVVWLMQGTHEYSLPY